MSWLERGEERAGGCSGKPWTWEELGVVRRALGAMSGGDTGYGVQRSRCGGIREGKAEGRNPDSEGEP